MNKWDKLSFFRRRCPVYTFNFKLQYQELNIAFIYDKVAVAQLCLKINCMKEKQNPPLNREDFATNEQQVVYHTQLEIAYYLITKGESYLRPFPSIRQAHICCRPHRGDSPQGCRRQHSSLSSRRLRE